MAEKMDKQPAEQQPRAAPPFLDIDVQFVNLWTFFDAVAFTISFGVGVAYYYTATLIVAHYPSLASWLLPCAATKLTDAEGTLASALLIRMLWCSTPQAAAGALALLLPCHRWRVRRAAAYTALALTVASHCMFAGAVRVVVRADSEGLYLTIVGSAGIFVCALGDLLGFLALLRGEWAS